MYQTHLMSAEASSLRRRLGATALSIVALVSVACRGGGKNTDPDDGWSSPPAATSQPPSQPPENDGGVIRPNDPPIATGKASGCVAGVTLSTIVGSKRQSFTLQLSAVRAVNEVSRVAVELVPGVETPIPRGSIPSSDESVHGTLASVVVTQPDGSLLYEFPNATTRPPADGRQGDAVDKALLQPGMHIMSATVDVARASDKPTVFRFSGRFTVNADQSIAPCERLSTADPVEVSGWKVQLLAPFSREITVGASLASTDRSAASIAPVQL